MSFAFSLIAPEGAMFLLIMLLFAASAFGDKKLPVLQYLPYLSIAVLLVSVISLCASGELFSGTYRIDLLSQFFKAAIVFGFAFVVINSLRHPTLEQHQQADYFLFMALSAWGLMLLASAAELVTLYLALELSSYSLYVLIPIRGKTKESAEAGAKYILFGAAATALSLYGLSHIIAAQHTTFIRELVLLQNWSFTANPEAVMGLSLFLCGMFYKLALFPFHFWCPDVYQGASNETAAYVATLPKLGAVIILIRLAAFLKPGLELTNLLAGLALLSMTFGNFCALAQKDVKRLLGFSSVAHAGYIVVGLVAGTAEGMAATAFYALAYVIMNLLCFWVVSRVAMDGRNILLSDLNGLHKRSPILAFSLAVGAFALVGLPPTVGFMGKLFLLSAAWGHGYNWLVIGMVLNSAIAIYYYLSLVRHAYTEEDGPASLPDTSRFASVGALVLACLVLVLGVIPAFVFDVAVKAAQAMML
ncbi:NADH-quinone oxidoreductase subunit N [Deltaproteobacteria bacterium]|nr:NADH-quinone oxidoreductase subunit N [Deltaproteobacteria bacterium]